MLKGITARGVAEHLSLTAIASFACAVVGWLVLPVIGSIVAIILGHCAQRAIGRSWGALYGNGLATAGLILGYMQLFVVVMLVGMSHLPPQVP